MTLLFMNSMNAQIKRACAISGATAPQSASDAPPSNTGGFEIHTSITKWGFGYAVFN